jgi:hypothetical protein
VGAACGAGARRDARWDQVAGPRPSNAAARAGGPVAPPTRARSTPLDAHRPDDDRETTTRRTALTGLAALAAAAGTLGLGRAAGTALAEADAEHRNRNNRNRNNRRNRIRNRDVDNRCLRRCRDHDRNRCHQRCRRD